MRFLESSSYYYNPSKIYVSDTILENINFTVNQQHSTIKVLFQGKYYPSDTYTSLFKIAPNENVAAGTAYVSSDFNSYCTNGNCKRQPLTVEVDNLYYDQTLELTIAQTYSKWMLEPLLGVKDFDLNNGTIYINPDDYNTLLIRNFQSSVFVSDIKEIDATINKLQEAGFSTWLFKGCPVETVILYTYSF